MIVLAYLIAGLSIGARSQNNALTFDGCNDYDSVPNASALIANSSTMTLEGWVNPSSTFAGFDGYFGFKSFGLDASNNEKGAFYISQLSPTSIEARFRNSSGDSITISQTISSLADSWHHYALTYDGTLKFYIYGGLKTTQGSSWGTITQTDITFLIWATQESITNLNAFNLNGKVEEVRLWNTCRIQAQIKNNMNNTVVANATGLKLYYRFDSSSSITLNDVFTTNDGTVTGLSSTGCWVTSTTFPGITTPAMPTSLSATPGNTSATIYFTAG